MNAIAKIEPRQVVPNYAIADLERMAIAFARSGLFGAKTPDQALALCLIAQAEGKHPAIAAKSYHIINGNPSKKADAMLGDFQAAGGRVEWHEYTDASVSATFSHPEGGCVRVDWDNARVQTAGLSSNPNHKKYPRAMKRARCISEGVRTVYPGATSGMYAPEEIQDGGVINPLPQAEPLTGAALLEQAKRMLDEPETPADVQDAEVHDVETGELPPIDKAAAWADTTLAAIATTADRAALAELQQASQKALAKLSAQRPELSELVSMAFVERLGAFDEMSAVVDDLDDGGAPF